VGLNRDAVSIVHGVEFLLSDLVALEKRGGTLLLIRDKVVLISDRSESKRLPAPVDAKACSDAMVYATMWACRVGALSSGAAPIWTNVPEQRDLWYVDHDYALDIFHRDISWD
jgi:hypothetical protein